jgi:hypothetical protein
VAIVAYFRRAEHSERATTALILPAIAAVLLVLGVVLAAWHFGLMIGVASNDATGWLWPLGFLAVALLGLGWALWAKRFSPAKYKALASSLVAAPAAPQPQDEALAEGAR